MYRKRADIYTTQGGDKMQGLFITFDSRNKRHAQNKAYGTNRDKIVYQNQVGGIGIRLSRYRQAGGEAGTTNDNSTIQIGNRRYEHTTKTRVWSDNN